jgi:hypothetical protein
LVFFLVFPVFLLFLVVFAVFAFRNSSNYRIGGDHAVNPNY